MTKILIIDDNQDHALTLAAMLEAEGHAVSTSATAEHVVENVAKLAPDLVLLDVRMPRIDGYEAARALRSDTATKDVAIIMQSVAEDLRTGYFKALEAGADDYIAVPVSKAELAARVEVCIRRKRELGRVASQLKLDEARLESFFNISQKKFATERELVSYVLEDCVKLTGSKVGYCHFFDDDLKTIKLFCWSKSVYKECSVNEEQHYPADLAGIWADPVRTGKPAIHNDYQHMDGKKGYPEGHFPVIRHMSVPVIDAQKVVAIIGVGNKESEYNDADIRQLQSYVQGAWSLIKQHRAEQEIKEAGEAMKREQALSTAVIDSIPGTFYMLDENGCYVRWNSYQRDIIVGKSEAEMLGFAALETIHPDDRDLIMSRIKNVLTAGKEEVVEGRVILRGGPEYRWLLMTGRQMIIDGRPYLVGTGIDITDRKMAESALKGSEEYLSKIIDTVADPVFVKDAEHRWVLVNKAFCDFMGRSMEEIIGKSDYEFFPKEEADVFWQYDEKVLKDEIENVNEEAFTDSRGVRHVIVTKKTIYKDPGGHSFIVGIIRDITDRKKSEEELNDKVRELERFYNVAIGREKRIIELKNRIKELEAKK